MEGERKMFKKKRKMFKKIRVVVLLFLSIFIIGNIDKKEVFAATSTNQNYAVNVPLRDGIDDATYKSVFEPIVGRIM